MYDVDIAMILFLSSSSTIILFIMIPNSFDHDDKIFRQKSTAARRVSCPMVGSKEAERRCTPSSHSGSTSIDPYEGNDQYHTYHKRYPSHVHHNLENLLSVNSNLHWQMSRGYDFLWAVLSNNLPGKRVIMITMICTLG